MLVLVLVLVVVLVLVYAVLVGIEMLVGVLVRVEKGVVVTDIPRVPCPCPWGKG